MSKPRWYEKLLETTRGRVLELLRVEPRTVAELARDLDLTGNAVRRHLTALEGDRLVEAGGVRRKGVGKPARVYRLTEEGEAYFPRAYGAVLDVLLTTLEERYSEREVEAVARSVGRRFAEEQKRAGFPLDGPLEERIRSAVRLLEDLGGAPEFECRNGGFRIRGHSCPLAAATENHPEACALAEQLLTELLDLPVGERCERNGRLRCVFDVPADGAG